MAACVTHTLRKFPDRPVAWHEHDDGDAPVKPAFNGRWAVDDLTQVMRDQLTREVDRRLALETPSPAQDVNALDEVPCSTWFCPRNHLRPLSIATIAAGPPGYAAPVPPFRVVKGKPAGFAPGFIVEDKRGNRFLLKFDPIGHPGMTTGAETIGPIFMWAAGYNVPRAFIADITEKDLTLDAKATYLVDGVEERSFTWQDIRRMLAKANRSREGKLRVCLSAWIRGDIVGQFDLAGTRRDDPNDRIPHEHRRSLRAVQLVFAWLNNYDIKPAQTIDTWIEDGGRHYVEHYWIDWGTGFGSNTFGPKHPQHGAERAFDPAAWVGALFTLGLAGERSFQGKRERWERAVAAHPSIGWLQTHDWRPGKWRTRRVLPAFARMTDRDAYWGAKVVTSFTDEQIAAIVAHGGFPPGEAAYLSEALAIRRDRIGREYLTRVTAVERPGLGPRGLCFEDLAVARGTLDRAHVGYRVRVRDDRGALLLDLELPSPGAQVCVPIGRGARPYRVATITTLVKGEAIKPAHVHLSWRAAERRFVVVGMDRDE